MSAPTLELWQTEWCPASHRVRQRLTELGLTYTVHQVPSETTNAVAVVEQGARKTADGAGVVEQTREAFLEIGRAVGEIASRVEQIAAAPEQVTASATSMQESINEVAGVAEGSSAATEEVSASTEETSASTQQIAASAPELASNAEQLRKLVGRFQVNENANVVSEIMTSALDAHRAWKTRLRQPIDTSTSRPRSRSPARMTVARLANGYTAPTRSATASPNAGEHCTTSTSSFIATPRRSSSSRRQAKRSRQQTACTQPMSSTSRRS